MPFLILLYQYISKPLKIKCLSSDHYSHTQNSLKIAQGINFPALVFLLISPQKSIIKTKLRIFPCPREQFGDVIVPFGQNFLNIS